MKSKSQNSVNPLIVESRESEKAIVSLLKGDILRIEFKQNVYIVEEDMDVNYNFYKELTKGKAMPFVVVFGKGSTFKREVNSQFMGEPRKKLKSMEAFVLTTLPHRILLNYYVKFFKPDIPTKIFSDESAAIEWINQNRKK